MRAVDPTAAPPVDNRARGHRGGAPVFRASGPGGNARLMRDDPGDLLAAAHAACGDAVAVPVLPGVTLWSFAHPDAVRQIVTEDADALVNGRIYGWLRSVIGLALVGSDGHEHAWRRATLNPAFTRRAVESYAPTMAASVARAVERWQDADGRTVDVLEELNELALRTIGGMLFGHDFSREASGIQEAFDAGTRITGELLGTVSQFLPRRIPTRANRDVLAVRARIDTLLGPVVDRRLAERSARTDLIGRMICPAAAQDGEPHRPYRTRREILDEVKGIAGAGHETTANLLAWALYFAATHPEVQERLSEEAECAGGGRSLTADDLPALPYAGRVVRETLRLMPPSWAVMRDAAREITISGVTVPRRGLVVCPVYVTQRDPRWYPEPLRFRPDRPDVDPPAPTYAFYPFSRGPQYCIGKSLAEAQAVSALAELVRNFRFDFERGRFVAPVTRVNVRPRDGMPLLVRRRRGGVPVAAGTGSEHHEDGGS